METQSGKCQMRVEVGNPVQDRFKSTLRLDFHCDQCNMHERKIVSFDIPASRVEELLKDPYGSARHEIALARLKRIFDLCPKSDHNIARS